MSGLRLTIGAKLGISAAAGILLAGTIVVAQLMVGSRVQEAEQVVRDQQSIEILALQSNIALRRMQAYTKDIRLTLDPVQVDKLAKSVEADMAEGEKLIDQAADLAALPANKERLEKIGELFAAYGKSTLQIAEIHKQEIAGHAERDEAAGQWNGRAEKASNALAASSEPDRLLLALADAERDFQMIRANSWRYAMSHDESLLKGIEGAEEHGAAAFASLRAAVGGVPGILQPVNELSQVFDAYVAKTKEVMVLTEKLDALVADVSVPAATQAIELVREAIAAANARVTQAKADAATAVAFGNAVVYGMVGLLIVVLVGSAFYAIFGIARPLSAMTRAMDKIGQGALETEIPSAGRGDELGEQSKVLGVFRDGLAEAKRLREEQATNEVEAAKKRKADMLALAEQFEAAVGKIVEMVSSAATELQAAAQSLTATSEETAAQAAAVAAAAEEAATNVQTVAAAVEELARLGERDRPAGQPVDHRGVPRRR